jgi:hypothetical protein
MEIVDASKCTDASVVIVDAVTVRHRGGHTTPACKQTKKTNERDVTDERAGRVERATAVTAVTAVTVVTSVNDRPQP